MNITMKPSAAPRLQAIAAELAKMPRTGPPGKRSTLITRKGK